MNEIYSSPFTSPAVTHSYFLKALCLSTFRNKQGGRQLKTVDYCLQYGNYNDNNLAYVTLNFSDYVISSPGQWQTNFPYLAAL